ncbi:hypothetical protein ACI4BF_28535, partial [Klebsiella pneumoniae]|uniref:hypothetical protein n=1 Tax=Klebsiella pneumoniae TaxID=573 RepID=UPI003852DE22
FARYFGRVRRCGQDERRAGGLAHIEKASSAASINGEIKLRGHDDFERRGMPTMHRLATVDDVLLNLLILTVCLGGYLSSSFSGW